MSTTAPTAPPAPRRLPTTSSSSSTQPPPPRRASSRVPPSPHASSAAAAAAQPVSASAHAALHPSLPSASTERHVAQARAAVVASIGNMLDAELQSRAHMLHENAAVLDAQERDVVGATALLGRESARLAKEADGAARKLKEVGNVQNWAEVLERGFLVLEETVRLAREGGSCSCSDCGGESGGEEEDDDDDVQEEGRDAGKRSAAEGDGRASASASASTSAKLGSTS